MVWSGLPALDELPTLIWSGLFTGGVSAALAVCLVLSFRVTRVINLAVGAFYVVGAFVYAALVSGPGGVVAAASVVVGVGFLLGVSEERVVLYPLRKQPPFTPLLATIGLAIVIEGLVIVTVGRQPVAATGLLSARFNVSEDLQVSASQILLFLFAVVVAVGSETWLRRSPSGQVLAATTDDAEAAMMLGIDVDRLRMITNGAVGSISAIVGMLAVPLILVDFAAGLPLSLAAFIAAVLGGGLSPIGALVGGLVFGLIEAFGSRMLSSGLAEILSASLIVVVVLLAARFPAFQALQRR